MPAEVPLPLKPRSMLATSQPPSKVMPPKLVRVLVMRADSMSPGLIFSG